MCGRYTITVSAKKLAEIFKAIINEDEFHPRYNAAPSQSLPVISDQEPEHINFYRWGLIPYWAKDEKIASKLINARSETITEKPSFRNAFKKRHCLVLTDGYYEWKKTESGKTPYRITLKDDEPFAFAGIWESWKSPENEIINTFSLITTEANKYLSEIHHRMPVIIRRENMKDWLRKDLSPEEYIGMMNMTYSDEMFKAYQVPKLVNYPSNDSAELIEAVS